MLLGLSVQRTGTGLCIGAIRGQLAVAVALWRLEASSYGLAGWHTGPGPGHWSLES